MRTWRFSGIKVLGARKLLKMYFSRDCYMLSPILLQFENCEEDVSQECASYQSLAFERVPSSCSSSPTMGAPKIRIVSVKASTIWDVKELTKKSESKKSDAPTKFCNRRPEGFKHGGPFSGKRGESIYECGVPKLGEEGPGERNMLPNEDRYAKGWCRMHVTQHRKPDPSKDQYRFDVTMPISRWSGR